MKPAWCGTHLAGLWPEQGLQPVTRATAFQAVVFTVTANLPFSEWTTMFPQARLCKAMLDRLTDQAHIIETGTESYRFRRTLANKKKKGGQA